VCDSAFEEIYSRHNYFIFNEKIIDQKTISIEEGNYVVYSMELSLPIESEQLFPNFLSLSAFSSSLHPRRRSLGKNVAQSQLTTSAG
jgi:hypothetical protein